MSTNCFELVSESNESELPKRLLPRMHIVGLTSDLAEIFERQEPGEHSQAGEKVVPAENKAGQLVLAHEVDLDLSDPKR